MTGVSGQVRQRSSKRIALSALIYVGLSFFQRGISLLILPFITRVLTPSEYGAVSVVTFTSTIVGVVLGSALEPAILRWSVRDDRRTPRVLWICQCHFYFLVPVLSIALGFCFHVFSIDALGINGSIWAVEIAATGLVTSVTYFAMPLIRARDQLLRYAIVSLVGVLLTVAGKAYFVILGDGGVQGWVISDLIAAVFSFIAAIALSRTSRAPRESGVVRTLWVFSLPLLPGRIAAWALNSLSRPVMAVVATEAAVGIYSLALNLAAVSTMVIGEINRSLSLEYSRESFPAPSSTTMVVARYQIIAGLAVPAGIGIAVFILGPALIGPEFQGALPLVGILLLGQAAYALFIVPNNYVVLSAGRTGWSWIGSTLGMVVMLAGILLYGGRDEGLVASIATVLGFFVMNAGGFALLKLLGLKVYWRRIAVGDGSSVFCLGALCLSSAGLWFLGTVPGALFIVGSALLLSLAGVLELIYSRRNRARLGAQQSGLAA